MTLWLHGLVCMGRAERSSVMPGGDRRGTVGRREKVEQYDQCCGWEEKEQYVMPLARRVEGT